MFALSLLCVASRRGSLGGSGHSVSFACYCGLV